ncbi:MAG: hypothetical protein E6G56_11080 [Actinobacteria bacterium]|nr:MAG: hypothetical protein E6G56_11080 [Actinomycetota bacterium]
MRALLRMVTGAAALVGIMFAGSILLWVGIPLGWLWIASQIDGATGSVGAAIGAALVGVVASIALMVPVLTWLSNRHRQLRMESGRDDLGHLVLEVVMVTSAGVALVVFALWFFLLSGSSPIPFEVGY